MKTLLLSISAVLTLTSSLVWGQCCKSTTTSLNVASQDRYLDTAFNKSSLQSSLTIKGSVDLNGWVEINAVIQSGNYNSGFNTIYNMTADEFNNLDAATKLYVKKIYLKKVMMQGNLTASLGALENRASTAQSTALSSAGWVDGVRVELKTKAGVMNMITGQIKTTEAQVFNRIKNFDLNYFEISMNRQVFEKLLVEGGLEFYQGKPLIEMASRYDIEIATAKIIKLIGEVKLDAHTGGVQTSAGIQDIISIFRTKPTDVKLAVNYEYISSQYNVNRNKLGSSIHSGYTGGALITSVQFPIFKKLSINGFTNVRIGNQKSNFRVESGVTKTIFNKNYKKK